MEKNSNSLTGWAGSESTMIQLHTIHGAECETNSSIKQGGGSLLCIHNTFKRNRLGSAANCAPPGDQYMLPKYWTACATCIVANKRNFIFVHDCIF